jgi:hypothetical protein
MNDLIRAFFERDLSETEKDALGALLKSSPEASQEFSALAAKKYEATSLPEPRWPHPSGWAVPTSLKVAGTLIFAVAIGYLAFKGPELIGSKASAPEAVGPSSDLANLPDNAPAAVPAVRRPAAKAPVLVTPESFVEGRKYTGLLAVVDKSNAAFARVRVVDGSGREVRLLYAGMLPKGTWVFRWDGLLEGGASPKAGAYSIEVLSAGKVLRQPVTLTSQ